MSSAIPMLALAVALVLLGRWGRGNADRLVPAGLGAEERARRVRVLRRGAAASYVVAAVFVAFAIAAVV